MSNQEIEGKSLSAFRTEIELGMPIYCLPDSQVYARKLDDGTYGIFGFKDTFSTFDELLADNCYTDFFNDPRWVTLDTATK